ncbi:GNAT family N-acetyltransferase [Streptococcus pneumoniae]
MENIYVLLAENRNLETERLLLRPVTLDDAEVMYAYASDEETTRYVFPTHTSLEGTKSTIAQYFLQYPLGCFGIELKSEKKLIGTISLMEIKQDIRKAELGYCLSKEYWNKGYATETLSALLKLAFEVLSLNAVTARFDRDNLASGRVMEKAGMRFSHEEPYAMMDRKVEGRIVTLVHYLLTKENYKRNNR